MPNTHRRRRRDATKQFSRVGGVYWALDDNAVADGQWYSVDVSV